MEKLSDNLLTRLLTADVCCKDCGTRYGKYSVGVSSSWYGNCQVCGEYKSVTEVRDWGYLTKGIKEEKAKIKEQSADVAKHIEELFEDLHSEEDEPASYEQGEIVCKFTEGEVDILSTILDQTSQEFPPGKNIVFDSAFEKIHDLFEDYCIKYELSPALLAYRAKYGTWGTESPEEEVRWQGFRDAFNLVNNNDQP